MNKIIVLSLLLTITLVSCKSSIRRKAKETSKLEIAKQYYKALDNSDVYKMSTLLGDSLVVRENADNYEERFSQNGYNVWLEWDSVFKPTYKILEIEEETKLLKQKFQKLIKESFSLPKSQWFGMKLYDLTITK